MSIKYKLLALITLPTLLVVFLGVKELSFLSEKKTKSNQVGYLTEMAIEMAALIHEVQKERGMSVGLIGSKGAKFEKELQAQRKLVDQAEAELLTFLASFPAEYYSLEIKEQVQSLTKDLDKIPTYRAEISALKLAAGQAATFYTGINRKMLIIISQLGAISKNQTITARLTAYSYFLNAKDEAGIERAMLSAAFGANKFPTPVLKKYLAVRSSQDVYVKNFLVHANTQEEEFFKQALDHSSSHEVDQYRQIADSKIDSGGFNIDPVVWFGAKTEKLNQLKQVEDFIASNVVELAAEEQKKAQHAIIAWSTILGGAFLVLILISIKITFSLLNPLKSLQHGVESISKGDNSISIEATSKDEIGELARGFNIMADHIRSTMESLEQEKNQAELAKKSAEQLQVQTMNSREDLKRSVKRMLNAIQAFAQGDLTVRLPEHSDEEIDRLFSGFNGALIKLQSLVADLKEVVVKANNVSTSVSLISTKIAGDVQKQSNESIEIAGMSSEMTYSITNNARLAASTSDLTSNSARVAEKGIVIVGQTIGNMQSIAMSVNRCVEVIERLGSSSKEINDVASVIEEIAEQTNLLALNAAIEAARAGESGRGFAVVADEVRKLAERTKDSTIQISTMVQTVQNETANAVTVMREGQQYVQEGLNLADSAQSALQDIDTSIKQMTEVVGKVATSTDKEADTSELISSLSKGIANQAKESDLRVQEIVKSLEELDNLATRVTSLVNVFKVEEAQELAHISSE